MEIIKGGTKKKRPGVVAPAETSQSAQQADLAAKEKALEQKQKDVDARAEALDRKQKEGWLVLYLGASHDAWAQASAIGLHAGNVAAFDKRAFGVSMAAFGARSKRYAMAADATDEAESGGFTDGERAGMRPTRTPR